MGRGRGVGKGGKAREWDSKLSSPDPSQETFLHINDDRECVKEC